MMRQMRENTKWIMLATALSFVALMVFQWGMDISGRSALGVGEIGRVNGTPIMYDQYMAAYRNLSSRVQEASDEPITSQRSKELEDQAFDEVVTQILMAQELERRGIRVTDEEILQAARFSPPPELQQQSIFMTDGQFDLQKYQQFIASPQADENLLLYLETYYRTVIPRAKLMRQITMGMHVSDGELWQAWRDDHETVQARFVALHPGMRVPDSDVTVAESAVRAYFDEHPDEFSVPARAQVKAVVLRKDPTAADTAASHERAEELLQSLEEGRDFEEAARAESADQLSAEQGGDLGIVRKSQRLAAIDSAVFATRAGSLAGPVQSPSGFHIFKVEERWGQDSARVRHILLPIRRTDDSEIALLTLADSLETLGESHTLDEAAGILGLQVQSGDLTEEFAFIAGAGQVGEGSDWAFQEAAVGDVSPVFENSQAFYALQLESLTPGGVLPYEGVRAEIGDMLLMRKKVERAEEEAADLVSRVRSGTPFTIVANEAGLQVQEPAPFTRTDFVPGMGRENPAVGAAFGLRPGEVSDPVTADQDVFVIEQIARTPADSAAWEAQKEVQRSQVLAQWSQTRVTDWIEGLRASARIVDRRDEALQPSDDSGSLPARSGLF